MTAGIQPTAIVKVVPVPAKVGSYPSGTTIVGQQLNAPVGGFRAWFEMRISHWDPNGDDIPALRMWQMGIDKAGFLGENADPPNPGVNLTLANNACNSDSTCAAVFGEAWADCDTIAGSCMALYLDGLGTGRPDSWCADTGNGACDQAACDVLTDWSPRCGALMSTLVSRPDAGLDYYAATVVLDIPSNAHGRYTVGINFDQTFLADVAMPPNLIPTLPPTGFVVNIAGAPNIRACCLSETQCVAIDADLCTQQGGIALGAGSECLEGTCSPHRGACCDHYTLICLDQVLDTECEPWMDWTPDTLCADLPEPCEFPPGTGACCDHRASTCTDFAPESNCEPGNTWYTWTPLAFCADIADSCYVTGACCSLTPGHGGTCTDNLFHHECNGPGQAWALGESCATIQCDENAGSCCDPADDWSCVDLWDQLSCESSGSRIWRNGISCDSCTPDAQMLVRPVPAKVGAYPPGTTIEGNEITVPAGSGVVRVWFDAFLRNWDLDGNGDPPLHLWQLGLDKAGFLGANADPPHSGLDLSIPAVPCTDDAACIAAFGDAWVSCDTDLAICQSAYTDRLGTGRSDSWCADTGSGACDQAACDVLSNWAPRCFAFYPTQVSRPDHGQDYYLSTFVLDVPTTEPGRYHVSLADDQTFLFDAAIPPNNIPVYSKTGFVVNVQEVVVEPPPAVISSRSLLVSVPASATAAGSATAIAVRMNSLQNPVPPNPPCCSPQDFSAYEVGVCTVPGEGNGCARWLGPPVSIRENQDSPAAGAYLSSRLQCTPYYTDWTALGSVAIVGPEIMPSSSYDLVSYDLSCQGAEATCTAVGTAMPFSTRRAGDIAPPFAPTGSQPDSQDIVGLLNKFKNLSGAPSKAIAQVQPNVLELNSDVAALDIVAVIDAFRGNAYPFSGPCPCPSSVTCMATTCSSGSACSGGLCVKTCNSGTSAGQPCLNDTHCPSSTCGTGFCRDRCGRCRD